MSVASGLTKEDGRGRSLPAIIIVWLLTFLGTIMQKTSTSHITIYDTSNDNNLL